VGKVEADDQESVVREDLSSIFRCYHESITDNAEDVSLKDITASIFGDHFGYKRFLLYVRACNIDIATNDLLMFEAIRRYASEYVSESVIDILRKKNEVVASHNVASIVLPY